MNPIPLGRIAGIDFGTQRVGIAICDPEHRFASPLTTYTRSSSAKDSEFFRRLVHDENIRGFVVGLPVHMSGDESEKSREARAFGAWLALETELPVHFVDERYSTSIADQMLEEGRVPASKRKEMRDKLAAQVILRTFLEQSSPDEDCPSLDAL
jgi:putative holliday junction resolvase